MEPESRAISACSDFVNVEHEDRLTNAAGRLDAIAFLFEKVREKFLHRHLVIDDEDGAGLGPVCLDDSGLRRPLEMSVAQGVLDRGQERVRADRFLQKAVEIGRREIPRVAAGDHHDRDAASLRVRRELALDVASVQARQHEIEKHEAGDMSLDVSQRIDSVFDGDHCVALGDERGSIQFAKRVVVLDDQDRRRVVLRRK